MRIGLIIHSVHTELARIRGHLQNNTVLRLVCSQTVVLRDKYGADTLAGIRNACDQDSHGLRKGSMSGYANAVGDTLIVYALPLISSVCAQAVAPTHMIA